MFLLREPSAELVRQFILGERKLPFSYAEVGATLETIPAGYTIDHNRIRLGAGRETYESAIQALRSWKQFDLGWVKIVPEETPIEVGATVAVLARLLGFWSLNACRIVYLIGKEGSLDLEESAGDATAAKLRPQRSAISEKWGFAYGTLPEHAESGEERFTIEWHA